MQRYFYRLLYLKKVNSIFRNVSAGYKKKENKFDAQTDFTPVLSGEVCDIYCKGK